jgi:hypothetical protein
LSGGIFLTFLGIFLAVAVLVLLVTYVVRVAITIILIAGAPLALMCHALPQTEAVAYWWWKAFGGCLAIQLAQSLALITGLRVFLDPGGFTPFGATRSGLVNLIVALALLYILIKIPFWILGSLRSGGRRSLVGTVARAYVIGKAIGWVRGQHGAGPRRGGSGGGSGSGPRGGGGGPRGGGGGRQGGGGGGGPSGGGGPYCGGGPVNPTALARAGAHEQHLPPSRRGGQPGSPAGGAAGSATTSGRRAPQARQAPRSSSRPPAPGPPRSGGLRRVTGLPPGLSVSPHQGTWPTRSATYRPPPDRRRRAPRPPGSPVPASAPPLGTGPRVRPLRLPPDLPAPVRSGAPRPLHPRPTYHGGHR